MSLELPSEGHVYSPVADLLLPDVILGLCAWWKLYDADVEHFAFGRLRRFLDPSTVHRTTLHWVDISFMCCHGRTSLGNGTFNTLQLLLLTNKNPLEFIRVDSGLVTITTLFDGLEGHVCCLAVVVRSSTEHLSLNPCLCQTVCDVLDQFGHLYCSLLI